MFEAQALVPTPLQSPGLMPAKAIMTVTGPECLMAACFAVSSPSWAELGGGASTEPLSPGRWALSWPPPECNLSLTHLLQYLEVGPRR